MRIDPDLLKYASSDEITILESALVQELALQSPIEYAKYISSSDRLGFPEFKAPDHIELLEYAYLKSLGSTEQKFVAVNMPPRHGKSWFTSMFLPAWFLTKFPQRSVIIAGYGQDFASTWGRNVRNIIEAHPELGVKVDPSTRAADNFTLLNYPGTLVAVGAGGSITGRGADLFIIDDPIKNSEEALSETHRESLWNWYITTSQTRLEPGGLMVLMNTRWHEDDLTGRLLAKEPKKWVHINIPAISLGENDPLRRPKDTALWPERYSFEELDAIRKSQGSFWFTAMYQGSPFVEGGNIFRKQSFQYFRSEKTPSGNIYIFKHNGKEIRLPEWRTYRFQTVDLAASLRDTADYTAISTWALGAPTDDEVPFLFLLDVFRERIEGADHESYIRKYLSLYKPRYVGIERATFGLTLIQTLARKGLPVRELRPDRDKVSRAHNAAALTEAGRVYFNERMPLMTDFTHELLSFPNGAHDDMVDTFAYAAVEFSRLQKIPRKPEREMSREERYLYRKFKKKKNSQTLHPELGAWPA